MFAFAELIVNCDQQYCADVNLKSLELWGISGASLVQSFERICCICSQLNQGRIFWTVNRARCEEESPIRRIFCKVSVIRWSVSSLTRGGENKIQVNYCNSLLENYYNCVPSIGTWWRKILATQCKDFTRFAVLLVKARGSLLKCD